jgi:uncharacterized protein YkwD
MSDRDTSSLRCGAAHPWLLTTRAVGVAAVVIASLSLVSVATARDRHCAKGNAPVAAASRIALQRAVVCLIDEQRRSRGLPALRESSRLNRSAQGWTNTMVALRDFSHGVDFAARISAVGFQWSSAGENIATGFRTPAAVVGGWMASPAHCQNVLNPTYREVGTGVRDRAIAASGSQGGTWTQDFARRRGQPAASDNWGPAEGCPY